MAMHLRLRYGLIIAGFIVFAVLSPLFVLFLSGQRYDFTSGELSATGVLSITTKPTGATVTLNGTNPKTTPVNIRFLLPDSYDVGISKAGYFSWHKHLDIRADRVTYAHTSGAALVLLPDVAPTALVNGVSHYTVKNDTVFWLSGPDFNRTNVTTPDQTVTATLPFTPTDLTTSPNGRYLLLNSDNNTGLWNTDTNRLVILPTTVRNAIITNNGAVIGLAKTATTESTLLWQMDTTQPIVLANRVMSFTARDQNLYYLAATTNGTQLISQTFSNTGQLSPAQVLSTLPDVPTPATLYVTTSKTVFAQTGNTLWLMGDTPQLIANNVSTSALVSDDSIVYQTGLEWRVHGGADNQDVFITRSGAHDNVTLSSLLPYAFIWNQQGLIASELDNRDEPNRYQLSDQAVSDVTISSDAETLYYVVNKQLWSRPLR